MMRAKNDEVTAPNLTLLKNGQAWMKIQSCLAPESPALSAAQPCHSLKVAIATKVPSRKQKPL